MERRLKGAQRRIPRLRGTSPRDSGFNARSNGSVAVRRQVGKMGITFAGETGNVWQELRTSATGSPYRLTSLAVDRSFGRNWLSLGMTRLEEKQSLLGGRLSPVLGGGGSTSMFLDAEASHDFGKGLAANLTARRGWTGFAGGKFKAGAYAFDLSKLGVLGGSDRIGLRFSQPLRIDHGGFAMLLPTSYDYATETATDTIAKMSLTPNGRELDTELSYGSDLLGGKGWIGGNLFYRRQPGHIAAAPARRGRGAPLLARILDQEGNQAAGLLQELRRLNLGVSMPTCSR